MPKTMVASTWLLHLVPTSCIKHLSAVRIVGAYRRDHQRSIEVRCACDLKRRDLRPFSTMVRFKQYFSAVAS